MGMPLMMTSLENMVSSLVNERVTSKVTLSVAAKAAAAGTLVTWVIVKLPPDKIFLPARSRVCLSMVTIPFAILTPALISRI